ncbi:natural product biosynthesis luciferase-like monooxygenase domain-containing protein [Micromonospora pallida]|uniref:Natural product biosynthesis luciferase-like monooxygenase domain-containing protein n=1 Tax=Micromonospora pallida TaxID=145854 RepID=A0A1C6S8D7_9ACTN|nr:MupA/Atu3671 family FMN-dependent luciferase-like monooxygenase [Micromonospora pallida]SCL25718.1 natural product biosynthesis luciferase-like monooxygenase domain-containing protein [Micromonospora pallida]
MSDTGTDARRALLAQQLAQRLAQRSHPLSYPQQRLWFLDQLTPDNPVYNIPLGYRIHGPLDVEALQRALTTVVRRHEALRTVFRAVDGQPRQIVLPPARVPLTVRDVADAAEAAALAGAEARTRFDLVDGPVLRATLLRLGPTEHWLCLTVHHIVCDGWSLAILERELTAAYTGRQLPDLPVQYADFAEWQHGHLTGATLDRLVAHWRDRLADVPMLASLPTDRPRPPTQTYRGAHLDLPLDPDVTGKVDALARQVAATPFAVLLAAFAVVVRAHTGTAQVVVGSPVAGRQRAEIQPLIGFFANTLVQRIDLTGAPSFRQVVERTRDETRDALAHQDLPFEKLVEELHPSRDLAHNPLFQVLFSYHDTDAVGLTLPGCTVTPVPGDTATAKFDLTLSLTRRGPELTGRLEYSTDLFDPDSAERMAARFRQVLAAALAHPDTPVGHLDVLTPDERHRVLTEWTATGVDHRTDVLVHDLVAAQARRTPDRVAVRDAGPGDQPGLSYRELEERAERFAVTLRGHGVGADVPVGVLLNRGTDLAVTLLAILKAGGPYLPLDPALPADRLTFMVTDSGTRVVVTTDHLAGRLGGLPVVAVAPGAPPVEPAPTAPPAEPAPTGAAVPACADDLAYVIYTSGSTGRPKGVLVTHRNVGAFFTGMDREFGPDAGSDPAGPTWLAVTSASFDISVLELLWTLTRGFEVVIRGDEPTSGAATVTGAPVPAEVQARPMDFSLFYFGGDRGGSADNRYRLLIEGARFADRHGFTAVWTPERHFHDFGGLYPNPSVTAAAIATITERVQIRAGSVVVPLHDPLRVAEEWAVVDNLSGGRVGLSVASGWQPNDFVLAPERYADRKNLMLAGIDEVRRLWRGGTVSRPRPGGDHVSVRVYPPPVQPELPVWVTSARSPDTFRMAGEIGAGLLTHLLGHSVDQLGEKIAIYRRAWREAGHAGSGHVTLMVHTFLGTDAEQVRELVRAPLCAYLKSSFDLLSGLGAVSGSSSDFRALPEAELDALVQQAFDRFFDTAALLGTPEAAADLVDRLKAIEVDEVACLIDFGVDHDHVLAALPHLRAARDISEERRRVARADEPVATQLRRHRVTHLQCTPSLAGVLAEDPDTRAALGDLRRLLVGGEALPAALGADLAGLVGGGVHNMYGPTEATVWASTQPVTGDHPDASTVPLGQPLAGVRAYVVDADLRPTPINVPGELLLGGPSVTRGYHGRPALTAERFVPDPFAADGSRLYRTGDLARWRPDGTLEFLGRLDHQVKIHGHRIELGEIESVLAAQPDVRAAVVVVRGAGAHRSLAAYCQPSRTDSPAPDPAALRAALARALPDYMVPATVTVLDELPLTPNGKIDRNRLPDPHTAGPTHYQPPRTEVEQTIAEVWAQLLDRDQVGLDDNFFQLGGNSLLAVQARARLLARDLTGLSLVDLFRYPSVRALAAACSTTGERPDTLARVQQAAGRRAAALTAAVSRRARRS